MNHSVWLALAAAALFGASTPFAKVLVGAVPPLMLGGLLYLGSGFGLAVIRLVRDRGWRASGLLPQELPWLFGAILFGGMLGPVALMVGLTRTSGSVASLLLNLEAVLSALLAWIAFRENADRRVVLGMLAIVAGGVVLAWPGGGQVEVSHWLGPVAIASACLCWAIDNNLTRKVSASDALFIASIKGLVAGGVNTALALAMGMALPATAALLQTLAVGLFGYGFSLVLFVMALRGLGTARAGAYFSTAPFLGAAVALGVFREASGPGFWLACGLMGLGVWLHLTERHAHAHVHEPMAHTHWHEHDAHHQHPHAPDQHGEGPHSHPHVHPAMAHSHPHYPDIHHRHGH